MSAQRMEALRKANVIRMDGVMVRREIAAGILDLQHALLDPRAYRLDVYRVLTAQRGWGRSRSVKLLRRVNVSEGRRVESLTGMEISRICHYASRVLRNAKISEEEL